MQAGLHTLVADGVHNVLPVELGDQAQLYTIHGVLRGGHELVQLVHALTKNKTEATYETIFRRLGQELVEVNNNYVPHLRLVVDFEKAAINAVMKSIPGIEVEGCAFHLAQAWNRKRDKVGLRRYLVGATKDRAVLNWWTTIKGLPFLPSQLRWRVPAIYHPTIHYYDATQSVRTSSAIFAADGSGPSADLWCKWGIKKIRTTDAAEAYHSKLRRILKARNVGLNVILGRVRAAEFRAQTELSVLERVPEQRRISRRRDRERRRKVDEEILNSFLIVRAREQSISLCTVKEWLDLSPTTKLFEKVRSG